MEAYIIFCLPRRVKDILRPYGDPKQIKNLHLTLCAVGRIGKRDLITLNEVCKTLASRLPVLKAETAGQGVFTNGADRPQVMLGDAKGLDLWRYHILKTLQEHGFPLNEEEHGFIPHITLDYRQDKGPYTLGRAVDLCPAWVMDSITLSYLDDEGSDFQLIHYSF